MVFVDWLIGVVVVVGVVVAVVGYDFHSTVIVDWVEAVVCLETMFGGLVSPVIVEFGY